MMAHTRKQQGQYRKIIKDDNPSTSVPSSVSSTSVPSVPLSSSSSTSSLPSSSSSSTSISSTSTSSTPIIPMPDDQFKELMNKVCGDMYINMYKNM